MTRRRVLLAALAIAIQTSCSRGHAARRGAAPRRIVSLAPSTTETLFTVGAGDLVVARSNACDYPPEATRLPAVGGVEPDLEAILELRPDLVVGLAGASSARTADAIGAHGIPTWFPKDESLADIDTMVLGIGERTGRENEARGVVDRIHTEIDRVEKAVAPEPRPRAVLVVGLTPIVVAGPKSFAEEMLRRAGAVDVVKEGGAWQTLGFERLAELDPDVILDAAGDAATGLSRITPEAAGWRSLRAVRTGHVLRLRDDRVLRAGPRIGEGLAVLAKLLHPDAPLP
jgi:iron complex transport system substrate-binding protein